MNRFKRLITITIFVWLMLFARASFAENIDPYEDGSQYAYGENVGWLNFEPGQGPGVHVGSAKLLGYVWAENIGWISLSCENTSSCGTVNYGVTNDGYGNLSGYAWGENVGWISFSCENTSSCGTVDYGVMIDSDGNFDGYAWGENIGWINFGIAEHYVAACKVNFEDLANFVSQWLYTGKGLEADLSVNYKVDFADYSVFAGYWLDFCPEGWMLK